MADYETRGGYVFDDTANPAIHTPTLASQIAQAIDNTRFLSEVKCDLLSGSPFFGADMDGGFSVLCTGYTSSGTDDPPNPGKQTPIIRPDQSFGAGTNAGETTTALQDRWAMITVFTLDPGALANVAPGGGGEIALGTNGTHPVQSLLSFYTGSGITNSTGSSNNRVETTFSGETLIFFVHSVTGQLRMYWSGSTEIAWVIRVDFSPKQNA
jgi:hypothetical protein